MLKNSKNIYKLDSKNRFSVRGEILRDGKNFHLTLGLDGCLFISAHIIPHKTKYLSP